MDITKRILKIAEANLVTPMINPFADRPETDKLSKLLGKVSDEDLKRFKHGSEKYKLDKDKDWLFESIGSLPYYILMGIESNLAQRLTDSVSPSTLLKQPEYSISLCEFSNYSVGTKTPSNYKNYNILIESSAYCINEAVIQKYGLLIRDKSEDIWYFNLKTITAPPFVYVHQYHLGQYKSFLKEPWECKPGPPKEPLQAYYRNNAAGIAEAAKAMIKDIPDLKESDKRELENSFAENVASHVTLANSIKLGILDAAGISSRVTVSSAPNIAPGASAILNSNVRFKSLFGNDTLQDIPKNIWGFITNKLSEVMDSNRQKNNIFSSSGMEELLSTSSKLTSATIDTKNKKTLALFIIKFQAAYSKFKVTLTGTNDSKSYTNTDCLDTDVVGTDYFLKYKASDYSNPIQTTETLNKPAVAKVMIHTQSDWALSLSCFGRILSGATLDSSDAKLPGVVGLITDNLHAQIRSEMGGRSTLPPLDPTNPSIREAAETKVKELYFSSLEHVFSTSGAVSWHGDNLSALKKLVMSAFDPETLDFKTTGTILCDGPIGFLNDKIKDIKIVLTGDTIGNYGMATQAEFEKFILKNKSTYKYLASSIPEVNSYLSTNSSHPTYLKFIAIDEMDAKGTHYLVIAGDDPEVNGSVADFASLPSGASSGDLWETLDTDMGRWWISDGIGGWKEVTSVMTKKQKMAKIRRKVFLDSIKACNDFATQPGYSCETLQSYYNKILTYLIQSNVNGVTELQPIEDTIKAIDGSIKQHLFLMDRAPASGDPALGGYQFGFTLPVTKSAKASSFAALSELTPSFSPPDESTYKVR